MNEEINDYECTSWTWVGPYNGFEEIMFRSADLPEFMKMRCLTTDDLHRLVADKLIWRYFGTEASARQLLKAQPITPKAIAELNKL